MDKCHRPIYKMGPIFVFKVAVWAEDLGLGLFAWVASECCQGVHFEELWPFLHISQDPSLQLWPVSTNCSSSHPGSGSLAPAPPFRLVLLSFFWDISSPWLLWSYKYKLQTLIYLVSYFPIGSSFCSFHSHYLSRFLRWQPWCDHSSSSAPMSSAPADPLPAPESSVAPSHLRYPAYACSLTTPLPLLRLSGG